MMKVLLVEPPFSPFDVPQGLVGMPEPLALETVAANMVKNHDVRLLDMRLDESLDKTLLEFKPDVVATGSGTANLHFAKHILQRAKELIPKTKTIIGGHHVTFMPQDASENFIDAIVIGEGDISASAIVQAWEMNTRLDTIQGIVINNEGKQFRTPEAGLIDMDSLSWPARHLVLNYRNQYFQRKYRPIVSLNSSRGCPHRCSFCMLWKMNKGKYRTRSAELIVEEIASFDEKLVDFIDDNTIEDIERINKLADLLRKNNIQKKYKFYGRADTIAKNPETIANLADVGLEMILVGFEAIEGSKLEKWNKKSSLEINNTAIQILKNNNVDIISYFVVDSQYTHQDFDELWKYVDALGLLNPIFTILVPFHGTDLYEKTKENIQVRDYKLFDFFHSVFKTKLPLNDFYDRFAELYKKSYALERMPMPKKDISKSMIDENAKRFGEIFQRLEDLKRHHQMLMESPA